MLHCCDTISCRSSVRAGSIKMSGVALGRRRDIKINFRIHGVSQTNYFSCRDRFCGKEKKEKRGGSFLGEFPSVWQQVVQSERRARLGTPEGDKI